MLKLYNKFAILAIDFFENKWKNKKNEKIPFLVVLLT